MLVKDFLLQFVILALTLSLVLSEEDYEEVNFDDIESLPNIWEDEAVTRMVREIVARDLMQDHAFERLKRQYKRDIHSSSSTITPKPVVINNRNTKTTRKVTVVSTQRGKKPVKVTQAGNKNRVTSPTSKTTVKPKKPNNGSIKNKPTAPPTKYHYYPHNQHPYFLPECAIQQVCNAVYVRLNFTQPLCVCPPRYRDPCSASLNEDDNHTIALIGNENRKAVTLAKTCEQGDELRECRAPRDWSILALQNTRTGKSHYLVICKCPSDFRLEGPLPHDQPTYAGLPGINVFGMVCVPSSAPVQHHSKWRPVIHTSYRSKNTTIEAATNDTLIEA